MIDLHTHSTASDGTDTPAELIGKAREAGLSAVALTDHDTIRGLNEAEEAAQGSGIEFIRGCELSTSTDQGSMHILGLWLPRECGALDGFLSTLQTNRRERNQKMIDKLRAHGIDISMEEVEAKGKTSPGRPHMAELLQEKGYVETRQDAFTQYLGIGGKAYVPKISPRPEQAVRMLRDLGATIIVAHPLLRPRPDGWLDAFVRDLSRQGLDGLEAWHSAQNNAVSSAIIALANKYGLGLSGGSDYHGKNKPAINLGTGMGDLAIPDSVLENLKQRRRTRGLPC